MSHLKVTLGLGSVSAPPNYVVILSLVVFITLELFQINGINGSLCCLVASSASSDELKIKISVALIALTDMSVF